MMNTSAITDDNKRTKLYWSLHLAGWAAYVLFKIFAGQFVSDGGLLQLILNYGTLYILIVAITHYYKRKVLSKWVSLSFRKLLPRLLAGALATMFTLFLTTLVIAAIIYIAFPAAANNAKNIGVNNLEHKWQKGLLILSVFTDFIAVFLWSALYTGFKYFENMQNARLLQAEKDSHLKDMQLQQLIRQLNPHFLFNAINSIKALTLIDPEKARDALSRMSDILRYTLNAEKSPQIPLQKELMIVEDYLALEKIRFGKRLEYSILYSENIATWLVPPVIIQTLAENAVKHGISQLEQGGEVIIEAVAENACVVVRIQNTGAINTDKLFSGIGTNNTLHRLKLLYGDKASFSAINENENVVVTLKIPKAP